MFQTLLEHIARGLDSLGFPYMLIGGQAVLLYGEPREAKKPETRARRIAGALKLMAAWGKNKG